MSDEPLHRALLAPASWCIECPACEAQTEIHATREDIAGAIHADGAEQFLRCEACDALIEVVAVAVTQAYPAAPA